MVDCSHSSGTQGRNRAAASRTQAISSFLLGALADGPVLVTELEAGARAVGLLHEGRRIADARVFKQAKKAELLKLGIKISQAPGGAFCATTCQTLRQLC